MIKGRCYFLATLPFLAALTACSVTPSPMKTSLWKVSSAQRTVYIASDPVVLSASDYPLPTPFTKAFAASSELYVEQLPATSKKSVAELRSLFKKLGTLPENKTLEDVLTPTQLAAVKTAAKKRGIPFSHLDRFSPWRLAFVFRSAPASHSKHVPHHATKPTQQLTGYFYKKATTHKLPVTPFESDTKALNIASSLPMKTQIKWMMRSIHSHHGKHRQHTLMRQQPKIRKLVKAWRTGNTARVVALTGDYKGMPKFKAMDVRRNRTWVHVLEGQLHTRGRPIFVIVGDGHMMGHGNMLALLRNDGFQVRQL